MQQILAAILVVLGAGPGCSWLLGSQFAPMLTEFQNSADVAAVVGQPNWLLAAAFLWLCYGVAGVFVEALQWIWQPHGGLYSGPGIIKKATVRVQQQANNDTRMSRAADVRQGQ